MRVRHRRDREIRKAICWLVAIGTAPVITVGAGGAAAQSPPLTVANTADLARTWSAVTGGQATPMLVGRTLVAVMADRVLAFDAYRTDRCSVGGRCLPRWSASFGSRRSGPAALNGTTLYVPTATGLVVLPVGACAATTSCSPQFVAPTSAPVVSRPVVAGANVVVGTETGEVVAFDAAGVTNCSAAYGVCAPRWWARPGPAQRVYPVAGDGVVGVVGEDGRVAAYTEIPTGGCASAAVACRPRWTAPSRGAVTGLPGAGGGLVVIPHAEGLTAYPLTPSFNCTDAPVVCVPLWSAPTPSRVSALRVGNERVIVGTTGQDLLTYDTTARTGCTSLPATCLPVWRASVVGIVRSRPTITNGVVTAVTDRGRVTRYDLAGRDHCVDARCEPLWSTTIGSTSAPVATASTALFAASAAGHISAFRIVVDDRTRRHQGRPLTSDHDDTYSVVPITGGIRIAAPVTNAAADTRVVLSDPEEPRTADHEACATWGSESHWVDQEGIALRVHGVTGGGTSGITVTKNIWTGARWIFNVHVWHTDLEPHQIQIGAFDLGTTFFPNLSVLPLPWRMCAQVVGNVVTFQVWPTSRSRPQPANPNYGGSVRLPPGWSAPGRAGWYVGHLRPGDAVTYTNLTTSTLAPNAAAAGPVRAPTEVLTAP